MTEKQADEHEAFISAIVDDLKPVGAMEDRLARSVADSHWRMNRASAIENNLFAFETWNDECVAERRATEAGSEFEYDSIDRALAVIRTFGESGRSLQLVLAYEMRLHRKAQADLKQLRELQTARLAAAAKAVQEKTENGSQTGNDDARRETKPAPQPFDSKSFNPENGFVCSNALSNRTMLENAVADFLASEHPTFDENPGRSA